MPLANKVNASSQRKRGRRMGKYSPVHPFATSYALFEQNECKFTKGKRERNASYLQKYLFVTNKSYRLCSAPKNLSEKYIYTSQCETGVQVKKYQRMHHVSSIYMHNEFHIHTYRDANSPWPNLLNFSHLLPPPPPPPPHDLQWYNSIQRHRHSPACKEGYNCLKIMNA